MPLWTRVILLSSQPFKNYDSPTKIIGRVYFRCPSLIGESSSRIAGVVAIATKGETVKETEGMINEADKYGEWGWSSKFCGVCKNAHHRLQSLSAKKHPGTT